MKTYYSIFLSLILSIGYPFNVAASEVSTYFEKYRNTAIADYATETKIVATYSLKKLISEMDSFYTDTLPTIRQKAYYLTYKKGILSTAAERPDAVSRLVQGINDDSGGLIGQVISYLEEFSPSDFNTDAQSVITAKLRTARMPYYDDLVLLAGAVGIGKDILFQRYLNVDLPVKEKWNIALALARMGEPEPGEYCLKRIKRLPVNNHTVSYALPDLIYTRQKPAIDYCVELLYSDEKLCYSANPDISQSISCAYPIMEKLATVIVDFPARVDATGSLDSSDYSKTLQEIRKWFLNNKDYKIKP
jgi:hypothetical protein